MALTRSWPFARAGHRGTWRGRFGVWTSCPLAATTAASRSNSSARWMRRQSPVDKARCGCDSRKAGGSFRHTYRCCAKLCCATCENSIRTHGYREHLNRRVVVMLLEFRCRLEDDTVDTSRGEKES